MFHPRILSKYVTQIIIRSLSTSEFIKTDFTNGVKGITMCNEKTRNSLSIAMMENLIRNIKNDEGNSELRAIVISAEGPVFSAGHNLKELAQSREKQEQCFQLATELMYTIIDSPVPIIARVDGVAAAAGCQLVAQCDIAICSDKSTFSTPGANFGIFCSTPGVALARCVNKMTALPMLLTGLPLNASQATQSGLITKVCPSDKLDEEIEVVCKAIKSKNRDVIELGKKFYYKQIQYDVRKAYEIGGDKMLENLQMDDCKVRLKNFVEKKKSPGDGERKHS